MGPLLFFGSGPGKPLPSIDDFPVAKHTKGNARDLILPLQLSPCEIMLNDPVNFLLINDTIYGTIILSGEDDE
jgi:hypothetical protein